MNQLAVGMAVLNFIGFALLDERPFAIAFQLLRHREPS